MPPRSLLLLATFGLEIVECGGTLAKHARAGWDVHAAVLLSRPEAQPQIQRASQILGVQTRFLNFSYGEVYPDVESKRALVRVIRETRPDIVITQDPEHSFTDLDPDRREAMILYLEALSLAGRDFAVEACGGLPPHQVHHIYYMTPEHPNCVVDISDVYHLKMKALDELGYQLAFTAKVLKRQMSDASLRAVVPNYEEVKDNDLELGRALHREMEKALALAHGIAGHSGAALGEAYRREGYFKLEYLL
ncbi:MAG TPA: GlcNAc-PI de-N-acetylase [Caldilineae bacterium]|jgi:LmbE family N-acetylglucosaminyl deacetylase|nr:GlcNAc-PI de-N-acetylase [Caldilineae bacterium]